MNDISHYKVICDDLNYDRIIFQYNGEYVIEIQLIKYYFKIIFDIDYNEKIEFK